MTRKIKQSKDNSAANGAAKAGRPMELSDRLAQFEMWLMRNWKLLAAAAVVIVVALAVYLVIALLAGSREKAALEALAAAKGDQAKLAAAVAEHASAQVVNDARFFLASKALDAKKYGEAVAYLDAVAASSDDIGQAGEARLLAASAQELGGNLADAAGRFAAVGVMQEQAAARRAVANYQAGRIYLALGQTEDARAALENAAGLEGAYSDMAKALLYNLPKPQ